MVSYLSYCEIQRMFEYEQMFDFDDIADLVDRYIPSNSILRHSNESINEFAYRMQGSNDTLIGIIKDMIKKGDGQRLTHNFPLLISWIENEVSQELNNGYHILSENRTEEEFIEIWNPELEAYAIVLAILEKFISYDIRKQHKIAGIIK